MRSNFQGPALKIRQFLNKKIKNVTLLSADDPWRWTKNQNEGYMLDREGFRPNVGIILINADNQVWWGKRAREHSWQFPQGGIKTGETPEQAMYRELLEETGLKREHVTVVGRTRDWLRYEVPQHYIRRDIRGHYRGQKQIWFLLRLVGCDSNFNLLSSANPEFDAWRWHEYWVPLDIVIEFKRDVYFRALKELSRFLNPPPQRDEASPPRKRHRRRKKSQSPRKTGNGRARSVAHTPAGPPASQSSTG